MKSEGTLGSEEEPRGGDMEGTTGKQLSAPAPQPRLYLSQNAQERGEVADYVPPPRGSKP